MSLINQMLKDIDQRNKNDEASGGASSRYIATGRPRPTWIYLVLGLVTSVLFVLVLIWWLAPSSPSEPVVNTVPVTTEEEAKPSAPIVPAPISRNIEPLRTQRQSETIEAEAADPETPEVAVIEPEVSEGDVSVSETTAPMASQPSMNITRSSASPRELAQRHYDQGMALLGQGSVRQGATKLQEALLLAPEFHEAREELAVYYFTRGFLSDALQVLERGLEQFPGEPRLLLLQARMLERSGQQALALDLISEVPARFPQHADLFILRGALAEQLERL